MGGVAGEEAHAYVIADRLAAGKVVDMDRLQESALKNLRKIDKKLAVLGQSDEPDKGHRVRLLRARVGSKGAARCTTSSAFTLASQTRSKSRRT